MDRRYGLPGQYLTTGNPYARLLLRNARDANNGTHLGGLASALSQGVLGYLQGQDRQAEQKAKQDESTAYAAMAQGFTPSTETAMGAHPGMRDAAQPSPGGYQGASQALMGLQDNPYAGRLASQLAMKQYETQAAREAADRDFERRMQIEKMRRETGISDKIGLIDYEAGIKSKMDAASDLREINAERAQYGLPPLTSLPGSQASPQAATSQAAPATPQSAPAMPQGAPAMPAPQAMGSPPAQPRTLAEAKAAQQVEQKAAEARRVAEEKATAAKIDALPKARAALEDFQTQTKTVNEAIDRALALATASGDSDWNNDGLNNFATGMGSMLQYAPWATDANALQNELATIKSDETLSALQTMRQNSPTGGALGNVSDAEGALLAARRRVLDAKQGPQLVQALKNLKALNEQVIQERAAAFEADYGEMMQRGDEAPQGVDPEDWKFMTPEQKALFQ